MDGNLAFASNQERSSCFNCKIGLSLAICNEFMDIETMIHLDIDDEVPLYFPGREWQLEGLDFMSSANLLSEGLNF